MPKNLQKNTGYLSIRFQFCTYPNKIPPHMIPNPNGKTETVWLAVGCDESQPSRNIAEVLNKYQQVKLFSFYFHVIFMLISFYSHILKFIWMKSYNLLKIISGTLSTVDSACYSQIYSSPQSTVTWLCFSKIYPTLWIDRIYSGFFGSSSSLFRKCEMYTCT